MDMRRIPSERSRLRAGIVLGCAIAVAASLPTWSQTPSEDSPPADEGSRRALIDDGESPDLFLLYTGDVIGYIDPCG
jgi:hypothetical protein